MTYKKFNALTVSASSMKFNANKKSSFQKTHNSLIHWRCLPRR